MRFNGRGTPMEIPLSTCAYCWVNNSEFTNITSSIFYTGAASTFASFGWDITNNYFHNDAGIIMTQHFSTAP